MKKHLLFWGFVVFCVYKIGDAIDHPTKPPEPEFAQFAKPECHTAECQREEDMEEQQEEEDWHRDRMWSDDGNER